MSSSNSAKTVVLHGGRMRLTHAIVPAFLLGLLAAFAAVAGDSILGSELRWRAVGVVPITFGLALLSSLVTGRVKLARGEIWSGTGRLHLRCRTDEVESVILQGDSENAEFDLLVRLRIQSKEILILEGTSEEQLRKLSTQLGEQLGVKATVRAASLIERSAASETDEDEKTDGNGANDESLRENK